MRRSRRTWRIPTRIEPKERLIQGPVYAGVGARRTPPTVLAGMQDMARELADAGWYLRTGGAAGADNAFARGAPPGQRSVWVPWRGYNGWQSFACTVLREDELGIMRRAAARHHPAWERCPPKVRDLHARNVAVLLGSGMAYPADAVICWTERGRVSGGTGMTIRIARAHGIPVFNLAETEPAQAMRRLEGIAASVTASWRAARPRSARGRPAEPPRPTKPVAAVEGVPCGYRRAVADTSGRRTSPARMRRFAAALARSRIRYL